MGVTGPSEGIRTSKSSNRVVKVAFLMEEATYPPDPNNLKQFYVSSEMSRRGIEVIWIELGSQKGRRLMGGLSLETVPSPKMRGFGALATQLRIFKSILAHRVDLVYCDEWLFFRRRPTTRILLQLLLRFASVHFVFDQRDPFIDDEVAVGRLKRGSLKFSALRVEYKVIYRLSSLVILPSRAYLSVVRSMGLVGGKAFGGPRGVDTTLFKSNTSKEEVKKELGVQGRFVVGWIGNMHHYRQIEEVLIPLIGRIGQTIPNSIVLVGGRGQFDSRFKELQSDLSLPFKYLGFVKHETLPNVISGCDVLLCPINTSFTKTWNAAPLKILEALAVGRPVIATRTRVSDADYAGLKGVFWTESDLKSFESALKEVYANYAKYKREAELQSLEFGSYSVSTRISILVDVVLRRIPKGVGLKKN